MSEGQTTFFPEEFTPPGTIHISAAALEYAREFFETIGSARYVTTFDWAQSVSIRDSAMGPTRHVGACLMLGAYERREVPPGFIQTIGGIELAVKIPSPVWQRSSQRLIDIDQAAPFKLALR